MSNNALFNSGMQMPLFGAANQQQQSAVDDVDFQELFREYFNEDNIDSMAYSNSMAQLQAQAAMGSSLPTGQGIRTAFHGGSQQQPAMKRSRVEENLYLPTGAAGLGNSYNASRLGNSGLGVGGLSDQFSMTGGAGLGGAGLGSLGQGGPGLSSLGQGGAGLSSLGQAGGAGLSSLGQAQQSLLGGAASSMGLSMGMGLSSGIVGGSGGMQVSNINYSLKNPSQVGIGALVQPVDKEALEQQMTAERRLRNREHAKRSRVRKKFMLESLQEQVRKLQEENSDLRLLVQKHIPGNALKIIDDCCKSSPLFGIAELDGSADVADDNDNSKSEKTALIKTDFSLIESLTSGQQNFVLSDPRLPDNPIVFATPGFYELTGYTREQVLGRNCRFLQGPGTDPKAVDVIRSAIANGNDATVCILNYKADGTPFWNQFFVAALRDADNCIVNYVGVQTLVEPNAGASALEEKVNAAHPMNLKLGQEDDEKEDNDK